MRKVPILAILTWAFVILGSGEVSAISLIRTPNLTFDFKGYYKNLFFSSNEQLSGDFYVADLNRIRTEWDLKAYDIFAMKIVWDNEIIGGDFVNTPEFSALQTNREQPFFDLESQIAKKNDFFYGMALYRAYFEIRKNPMLMTVGRQRIDWGNMRLISPTDLFTPVTVYSIEKDEIPGTTAVNLDFNLGQGMRINPVYVPEKSFDKSKLGLRLSQSIKGVDWDIFGGRFLQDNIFGFDCSLNIKGAGLRGNFLFDHGVGDDNFVQFSLEVDYAIKKFYFNAEYLFNGQGTNQPGSAFLITKVLPNTANPVKTVHQNFLGFYLKYDPHPLISLAMYDIIDLNGGSIFINPEIRYSAFKWLDLLVGAQFPVGKKGGEFSPLPNVFYLQTLFYF